MYNIYLILYNRIYLNKKIYLLYPETQCMARKYLKARLPLRVGAPIPGSKQPMDTGYV